MRRIIQLWQGRRWRRWCASSREPVFDGDGRMKQGVIVRHLLLPGHLKNAKAVVKYVYETYGNSVYLSLMNQYTPLPGMERMAGTESESDKA